MEVFPWSFACSDKFRFCTWNLEKIGFLGDTQNCAVRLPVKENLEKKVLSIQIHGSTVST